MRERRYSVCALDCPDCCSLFVEIEDGRGVRLGGNPAHPVTQGFLCGKVAQYLDRVYSAQRILYPKKRVNGGWERISWDQALDEIAGRLKAIIREFGAESILPYSYAGTMGYLNGSGMDRRFFHRLGASRLDRTICSSAGGAGLTATLGTRVGAPPEDFRFAKLIVAWGANIHGTNIHLWPFIVEARRRGARLVVIDPIRTKTAALADVHLAPYPGADLALALGIAHVIFAEGLEDRDYIEKCTEGADSLRRLAAQYPPQRAGSLCGVPPEDIVRLARELATSQPAVIRLNYGVQRSERGAAAVRAIAMIPALTGAWRHRGGGLLLTTSGAFQINRQALERPDLQPRPTRVLNMSELGRILTEVSGPPIKALIVYNCNPAAIAPDQNRVVAGLRRAALFKVVLEQFQTDTADFADYVLPVTTFLEHTDLYFAYGHYYMQLARPALQPAGEAKPNVEIFRLLAKRMGFDEPCFRETEDDMIRAALDSGSPYLAGITLERLEAERSVRLNVGEPFLPFAAGRVNLDATGLDYEPPLESRLGAAELASRYPLELVSSKNDDGLNSTFGHRPRVEAQNSLLWIHPQDAAPRGIESGHRVRVFNDRGAGEWTAKVCEDVRPGVVRIPSVGWNKNRPGGAGVNVLTSSRLTDAGGGPTFYNCLVQVVRCVDHSDTGSYA